MYGTLYHTKMVILIMDFLQFPPILYISSAVKISQPNDGK